MIFFSEFVRLIDTYVFSLVNINTIICIYNIFRIYLRLNLERKSVRSILHSNVSCLASNISNCLPTARAS